MQNEKDMLFSNPKLKLTDEEFKAIAKAITMRSKDLFLHYKKYGSWK